MKAVLDKFGRVVIPKPVRDGLGLRPGDELELESSNGQLILRPVEHESGLRQEDGIWVHCGVPVGPELDIDSWIEQVRKERDEQILGKKLP